MKTCETNYAELLGHIMTPPVYSHSVYEEKFYQMKFGVPRLSGHVDVLPAVVSASLLMFSRKCAANWPQRAAALL